MPDSGAVASPHAQDAGASATDPAATTPHDDAGARARRILTRWNEAHNAHDAHALQALYAQSLVFYGTKISADEASRRKADAFKTLPTYAQRVDGEVKIEPTTTAGEVWVRFTKVTEGDGKPGKHPALLDIAPNGSIVEENDDVTAESDWCVVAEPGAAYLTPNTRVVFPFSISATQATSTAQSSKYWSHLREPSIATIQACAVRCAVADWQSQRDIVDRDVNRCGFSIQVNAFSPSGFAGPSGANYRDTIYVDPISKDVWSFDSGSKRWKNE